MSNYAILSLVFLWPVVLLGSWLGWQLLRQNGRVLLHLDELERRLDALEFGEDEAPAVLPVGSEVRLTGNSQTEPAGNDDRREGRFGSRSLLNTKIKRDGLKAGTPAPDFSLPRLDGHGELELSDLRGQRVLLVFSSPHCGPCNALAPDLEKFHRQHPEIQVVMISKGDAKENRTKVKDHGLTFPVVLQQHWEISRRYAMFATPVAYVIDEASIIANDVAVGTDGVRTLLAEISTRFGKHALAID